MNRQQKRADGEVVVRQTKRPRGKGEGSIYYRQDLQKYCAQVDLGRDPGTGKRRRLTLYGDTREKVAKDLVQALAAQQKGMLPQPSKLTVREFLEHWLETVVKLNVGPTSFSTYQQRASSLIYPYLGTIRLQKLTGIQVQQWIAILHGQGKASNTIRGARALLRDACEHAIEPWEILPRNPVRGVKVPLVKRPLKAILTAQQARCLLEATQSDRWHALWALLLGTGLRLGEALALRWGDVDLLAGMVYVRHTIAYVPGQKLFLKAPKTSKSESGLPLAPFVIHALEEHKRRQTAADVQGHIFATSTGRPHHHITPRTALAKTAARLGLPAIVPHGLRHSFSTFFVELNIHPRVTQELTRHDDVDVLLENYSRASLATQRDAVLQIERLLDLEDGQQTRH